MPRPDAYNVDPVRQQEADDFHTNVEPFMAALDAAQKTGDELLDKLGRTGPEGKFLISALDELERQIDGVRASRDGYYDDIKAGDLDVPTTRRVA